MSQEEKTEVIKFAIEYVNKRVPVIAGAGSNDTKTAISVSKLYESLGVDALLHVTPYYNKCSQKGLIAHYSAISENTNLPIILYNVPSRTGVNLLPATVNILSKQKNIVAVKEASGNIEQICEIIRLCGENFDVYSGDDGLTFSVLSLGGKGVISVASNIVPKTISEICKAFFEGNFVESRRKQLTVNPLIKALFSDVNPIPVKSALNLMGTNVGVLRLPLTPMESDLLDKLKLEMTKLNLLK